MADALFTAHIDHLIDDMRACRCDGFRTDSDATVAIDRWINRLYDLRDEGLAAFDKWAGLPERYTDEDLKMIASP